MNGLRTPSTLGRLVLTAVAGTALLVACGSDGASTATTNGATTAPPTTADPTTTAPPTTDAAPTTDATTVLTTDTADSPAPAAPAFPVTIEHAYGTLTLDEAPQRVITLAWLDADIVTALGTEPIAMAEFPFAESGITPWLAAELTTTPEIFEAAGGGGNVPQLNFEWLLSLQPDLIVATSYGDLANQYDTLSQIAPVLGPSEAEFAHLPWTDAVVAIGAALGKPDEAAALITSTEDAIDDAIDAHPELDGATYTLALGVPGALRLVQDTADAGIQLLDRFGMVINPKLADLASLGDGSGGAAVSAETVEYIDADVVLIAYAIADAQGEWETSPLFQSVPAVADGRYVAIDVAALTALRNPSPLSLPYAIDKLIVGDAAGVLQ